MSIQCKVFHVLRSTYIIRSFVVKSKLKFQWKHSAVLLINQVFFSSPFNGKSYDHLREQLNCNRMRTHQTKKLFRSNQRSEDDVQPSSIYR